MKAIRLLILLFLFCPYSYSQSKILIPMDLDQTNHLKAYGITFAALEDHLTADWLLNYRGGSFLIDNNESIKLKCQLKEVFFEVLTPSQVIDIFAFVQREDQNMDIIRLEKAPKIAVYVTPGQEPWDDAVTLAMEYAEVKYTKVWVEEIIKGDLKHFDWLHLHHEDFTGQYGKFFGSFRGAQWYNEQETLVSKSGKKNLALRKFPKWKELLY